MRQPPLFLLAFANHRDAWLQALSEEERRLRQILSSLHDQQRIELLSLGSTSVDDIYKAFNRYHNRIALFHFGGHSGMNFIHLVDQAHRATNLALLMGMQDHLHIVVLNGCANREQVITLLAAGIKVVIATSKEINDQWAAVFAIQFYEALASGKNIRASFYTAIGYLEEKIGFDRSQLREGTVAVTRAGRQGELKEDEVLPWGLYSLDEKVLNWAISTETFDQQVIKDFKDY